MATGNTGGMQGKSEQAKASGRSLRTRVILIGGGLALVGAIVVAAAIAASATSQIDGTVKNFAGTKALANIEVCALEVVEVNEEPVEPNPSKPTKCTRTNSRGHYVLEGLSEAEYFVDFAPEGDKPGAVVQYYTEEGHGAATTDWSEASEVEGEKNYEAKEGINARLIEFGAR